MGVYSVIGQRFPRIDAPDKAVGKTPFGADIALPDMLWGKALLSPHPHARILHIDPSRAERLPGVYAVITGQDVPKGRYGTVYRGIRDRAAMALDKVHFVGEPVAAVAAVDEDTAEESLSLIRVEYEILPAVLDPLAAMQADAPIIHEDLKNYWPKDPGDRRGNIYNHLHVERGDVERGFAQSHLVVEDTFRTQYVHQGYLEPHASVAAWSPSGRLMVWTAAQGAYTIRGDLALVFSMPENQIQVVPLEVGGGFGGKIRLTTEPLCALLAHKAGRPVKMVMTREEEFVWARPRPQCIVRMKTGVNRDGTLLSKEVEAIFDSGAYGGAPVPAGVNYGPGPYKIPNLRVDSYGVYTNKVGAGSYRAPGGPDMAFATESQMDVIAEALGMDPLDMRLRNAVEEGDLSPMGLRYGRVGLKRTLREAAAKAGWGRSAKQLNRGIGLACGQLISAGYAANATLILNEDGTVQVVTGAEDISGSHTSLAQMAAEQLGVPMERVIITGGTTDHAPFTWHSAGSRTVYTVGRALLQAAEEVKRRAFSIAAEQLEANPHDLELTQGQVRVKGSPERYISLAEVARLAMDSAGGAIVGQGGMSGPIFDPATTTQIAEVEVDAETGQVKVLRLVAAQDVGLAINPTSVEGQVQGAISQALGHTLTEEMILRDGRVQNPNLLDYKMPTALDMPPIDTIIVEESSSAGPLGVRGVGETPHVPGCGAIANAIYDAVGIRLKQTPFTPERVLAALKEKRSGKS